MNFSNENLKNNTNLNNQINNNDENLPKILIAFSTHEGNVYINCWENTTIEELLIMFIKKNKYYKDYQKLVFLYNGKTINHNDKRNISEIELKHGLKLL